MSTPSHWTWRPLAGMPRMGPFCVPLTTTRTTTWSPWPKMSSMVMCASGNATTTPANSPATLARPETVPTVPPYHCVSGVRKLAAAPPLCSLTTSCRNASTTCSFALTDPAPPRDGAAAWVRCAGAAAVAFAVAPATPRPAAARAAATAARCNLFMRISLVLGSGNLDLIVHVNAEPNNLICQVIWALSSATLAGQHAVRYRVSAGYARQVADLSPGFDLTTQI